MTNRKEKLLKGILNNLHSSFFSYSALVMMIDYIHIKRETVITLQLFEKKITNVKSITPENIKIINYYQSWLKTECKTRKVLFNEISEVFFTLSKRPGKILFFIPVDFYRCTTTIKTKSKIISKGSSSMGWL